MNDTTLAKFAIEEMGFFYLQSYQDTDWNTLHQESVLKTFLLRMNSPVDRSSVELKEIVRMLTSTPKVRLMYECLTFYLSGSIV